MSYVYSSTSVSGIYLLHKTSVFSNTKYLILIKFYLCDEDPAGATQESFIRGGSTRRFKPLPFNILIFTKMVPLSYTWSKTAPLSYTSRISQNNRISCNCHVFPGFSVVLIQLRSHFCKCGTLSYTSP